MGERLGYDDLPLIEAMKILMAGALAQGWPPEDIEWAAGRALALALRQLDPSRIPAPKRPLPSRLRVLGAADEED
jgi:hypothetical protein